MERERKLDLVRALEVSIILLPCLAALFTAYNYTKDVPVLRGEIAGTKLEVAVMKAQYEGIRDDLKEIKQILRRRP